MVSSSSASAVALRTRGRTRNRSSPLDDAAHRPEDPYAIVEAILEKESLDVEELVRRKKMKNAERLGTDSKGHVPSDLASFSVWHTYQGSNPIFLCGRPPSIVSPVPVTLLFEPLMNFRLNLKGGHVTQRDLAFAEDFWSDVHSVAFVKHHGTKVTEMTRKLQRYCEGVYYIINQYYVDHGVTMDAMALPYNKCGVHNIYLEYKLEPGKSGDPHFQLLDYVLRLDVLSDAGLQMYGVGLCITGLQLKVLALTVVEGKVWAEPLTIMECCGDFEELLATTRVWAAVHKFGQEYVEVHKFSARPVPWPIREFRDVQQVDSSKLVFMYINQMGQSEIAKFTQTYCVDAHTAWMPYAPTLRSFETLVKGKWSMVKMEYLPTERGWCPAIDIVQAARDDANHIRKIKDRLITMAKAGHVQGFVRGDMRLTNILLCPSILLEADGYPLYEVRILDFDWSGKIGEATYPRLPNQHIVWPKGVEYGAKITEAHDLWFVTNILEQL